MSPATMQPRAIKSGIKFTVSVEFVSRKCLISNEALSKLAQHRTGPLDAMATFRAYEATIQGVARRLVAANVPGDPLRLGPESFR